LYHWLPKATVFAFTGGYSELDLGRDVYRVKFAANGVTSYETAQCLWLYRCSELTLEKGFDGFEILSDLHLSKNVPSAPNKANEPTFKPAQYVIVVPESNIEKPMIEADIHLLKPPYYPKPPKKFKASALKAALEPHVADAIKSRRNVKPHVHDYIYPEKLPFERPKPTL
jgi:hypothetical protein